MPQDWRLAKSLVTLRDQINQMFPGRNKSWDGTIGDDDHRQTDSEHNPNPDGVVCAFDCTNDPAHGLSSDAVAKALIESRDPRIQYVISNGKIASSRVAPWQWRGYIGRNRHDHHFHISVWDDVKYAYLYDDPGLWDLSKIGKPSKPPAKPKPTKPMLKRGMTGADVKELQTLLGITADGFFGANTELAVKSYQSSIGLSPDGIVGALTWEALLTGKKPEPINYRSLVPGGYFSSTPYDRSMATSVRTNNPGAVNGAAWEKQMPGYVTTDETSPGNRTTIFDAPEHGIAVYWELLRRYRVLNITTVAGIINRYGGGQDYSQYLKYVTDKTGLAPTREIRLDGSDDEALMKFAKAMFRYEAGKAIPWSDEQIKFGFNLARKLVQA